VTPQRIEAPLWLRERIAAAHAGRGKQYQLAILQGFLEVPDWAYYLLAADDTRLLNSDAMLQQVFERVFLRATAGGDARLRILGGAQAEHYILIDGPGLAAELVAMELSERFIWTPDPDA
jgi:hypothetical protein